MSTPRQPTLSLFPCWSLIREGILLIDNLPYRATADLLAEGTLQFCPCGGLATTGHPCRRCGALPYTLAPRGTLVTGQVSHSDNRQLDKFS